MSKIKAIIFLLKYRPFLENRSTALTSEVLLLTYANQFILRAESSQFSLHANSRNLGLKILVKFAFEN
jgi:hypothetical protein